MPAYDWTIESLPGAFVYLDGKELPNGTVEAADTDKGTVRIQTQYHPRKTKTIHGRVTVIFKEWAPG